MRPLGSLNKMLSGRARIIKAIQDAPEGLSAKQVNKKVNQTYCVTDSTVYTALGFLVKNGTIKRKKVRCPHCDVLGAVYYMGKSGAGK